jgi:hypothetical protein
MDFIEQGILDDPGLFLLDRGFLGRGSFFYRGFRGFFGLRSFLCGGLGLLLGFRSGSCFTG